LKPDWGQKHRRRGHRTRAQVRLPNLSKHDRATTTTAALLVRASVPVWSVCAGACL